MRRFSRVIVSDARPRLFFFRPPFAPLPPLSLPGLTDSLIDGLVDWVGWEAIRLTRPCEFPVASGRVITAEELEKVHGRAWEDVDVSPVSFLLNFPWPIDRPTRTAPPSPPSLLSSPRNTTQLTRTPTSTSAHPDSLSIPARESVSESESKQAPTQAQAQAQAKSPRYEILTRPTPSRNHDHRGHIIRHNGTDRRASFLPPSDWVRFESHHSTSYHLT